jgi:hypothetical protein
LAIKLPLPAKAFINGTPGRSLPRGGSPVMIIITSMHSQRATKLHQWNRNHPPLRRPGVPGHTPVGSTSVILTSRRSQRRHQVPSNGTRNSSSRVVIPGSSSRDRVSPLALRKGPRQPHNWPGPAGSGGRKNPDLLCKCLYPKVTLRDCPSSGLRSLSELLSSTFAKHNGTP